MHSKPNNFYNQNIPHGQSSNKGYPANTTTDIYGKPVMNTANLAQEKSLILKEVEKNFNVKTLQNQMINNIKGDILNLNLPIKEDLILPIEMFYKFFVFYLKFYLEKSL